jgi:RNA polymerase sigma-70 factor, ECF subfamily
MPISSRRAALAPDVPVAAPPPPTLEALMQLALAGDQAAYAKLLQQLSQTLARLLARKVPAADRDDVLQDILLSVHKARHTYDPARAFLPWALAIARYRLQDHWRTYYRYNSGQHTPLEDVAEILGTDVTETMHQHEAINKSLQSLSPRQRDIIGRMYGRDASVQEVADQLKMNVSAVKVAAHRAYKILRQQLGEK